MQDFVPLSHQNIDERELAVVFNEELSVNRTGYCDQTHAHAERYSFGYLHISAIDQAPGCDSFSTSEALYKCCSRWSPH